MLAAEEMRGFQPGPELGGKPGGAPVGDEVSRDVAATRWNTQGLARWWWSRAKETPGG